MSSSLKGPYHEADDLVYDALHRRKVIIDDIVSYMTNFKTNGTNLLQKINVIIQEVHQTPVQNLTPSAVSILKWIIKHVGLAENISDFYLKSIEGIIQQFSKLSSDLEAKMNDMNSDLLKEEKKYNDNFNTFENSSKNYFAIHETLSGIQEKIEKYTNENNTSKVEKFKSEFEKTQKDFLASEKKSYDDWNNFINSKLKIAAEEEHFIVKWEQYDCEVYQTIQELLQKYSEEVQKISNDLRDLSQESLKNGLNQLREECAKVPEDENMKNFNYDESFKKLKKKYAYDESFPKFDFNIFMFMDPHDVFSFDLNTKGSLLMAKQNFTTKNLDEVEVKKGDILKVISFIDDRTIKIRNEMTGEIGMISNQYVKSLDDNITIIRQVRKIHEDNPKNGPRFVLAMSEPDPQTHLVKCMDADGTITMINDVMLEPPE